LNKGLPNHGRPDCDPHAVQQRADGMGDQRPDQGLHGLSRAMAVRAGRSVKDCTSSRRFSSTASACAATPVAAMRLAVS